MEKEKQIELKKLKPIEISDRVLITVPYTKKELKTEGRGKKKQMVEHNTEQVFKTEGEVIGLTEDGYKISLSSVSVPSELKDKVRINYENRTQQYCLVNKEFVSPTYYECGANPFAKEKRRINFYNQDIISLLYKAGYCRNSDIQVENDGTNRINFDPYIIDKNQNKQYYQRGLVWTLEQKQLLIDSIYNGIEIGKFLFRYNSWERMQEEAKESGLKIGHSFDCVDGKQRFFAIIDFVQNKFKDSHGNFWSDLSLTAQRRFLNYGNLSYGELPESASDEDVIDNFLTLNFTGTPMSKEHIEFVRSFNM